MSDLRIPTAFSIFGSRYRVEYRTDWQESEGRNGATYPDQHRIVLQRADGLHNAPPELEGQSFCHELVHAILEELRETRLNKDEKLVELLGLALHQALTTMEYAPGDMSCPEINVLALANNHAPTTD